MLLNDATSLAEYFGTLPSSTDGTVTINNNDFIKPAFVLSVAAASDEGDSTTSADDETAPTQLTWSIVDSNGNDGAGFIGSNVPDLTINVSGDCSLVTDGCTDDDFYFGTEGVTTSNIAIHAQTSSDGTSTSIGQHSIGLKIDGGTTVEPDETLTLRLTDASTLDNNISEYFDGAFGGRIHNVNVHHSER